jgi:hypothetical protein
VPLEAFNQPPRFGSRESLVEGRLAVNVDIVLDEHDGLAVREVNVGQILQRLAMMRSFAE